MTTVDLHHVVEGSGPPMLLLHRFPETHSCWDAVVERLESVSHLAVLDNVPVVEMWEWTPSSTAGPRSTAPSPTLPVLALWREPGGAAPPFDPLAIWRRWADDVQGRGLDCGHFLPEERPDEVAQAGRDVGRGCQTSPDQTESTPGASAMTEQVEKARGFLALHRGQQPLLLPNPWDRGSAVLLASLGFHALATTSSGFAATLGRADGRVTRDEAVEHAAQIVQATDLPVTADLENGFADEPDGVAATVRLAAAAGLAGCSVEDFTGDPGDPIYDAGLAAARVEAAAEAAHRGPVHLVLTARAENHLHDRPDLADTIARLEAYQAAGADVLYAPGLTRLDDIRRVVSSLDRPVNVLARPGVPPVPELAAAGVARVSVGGGFAFAALGAVVEAAGELRDAGTYGFWERAVVGARAAASAFTA